MGLGPDTAAEQPIEPAIAAALARGMTVLTPNQRAARTLRRLHDTAMESSGLSLWSAPPIFALDTWLPTLFHRLLLTGADSRLLLNRVQEHKLWRDVIASASRDPDSTREPAASLRSPDALAELAADAWDLLCAHNGRNTLRDFTVSTDTRAFARWAERFARLCTRNQYLPPALLPAELADALAEGTLDLPGPGLALVDFDTLPPATAQLLDSIRAAGYPVESIRTTIPATSRTLHTAPDAATELEAAAHWARQHLERNPSAKLAIVVPDLAERRSRIERTFHAVLSSEANRDAAPAAAPLFEFSLGRPLADAAPVAAAVLLLRWSLESLPLPSITALLLSPFVAAVTPAEALAAAEFDAFDLPRAHLLRPELSLPDTLALLRHSRRAARLPSLLARLRALQSAATREQLSSPSPTPPQQSHASWAEAFRTVLEAAGWTATCATSTSESFQALRRWESALDELATLDFDSSRPSASEALSTLDRILRHTVFAPESANAPIQILGPLELAATPFDALWFLAADDRTWPPRASSHPLIPWQNQHSLAMPGSDALRDNASAQRLTQRIAGSAPEVVFSYAAHTEDGPRRPSPLLRALALNPYPLPLLPTHAPLPLVAFADTEPLPLLPPGLTPGGAHVLTLQAACAFRAFAELRLHSTEPEPRNPGLDQRARGTQVHRIMQSFWTRLQTQAALQSLTEPEREALLDACIDENLRTDHNLRAPFIAPLSSAMSGSANTSKASPWELAYLEVQRQRLQLLLRPWLAVELARPPFEVLQQELKQHVRIGPLELELRADRIDHTSAGLILLDYKTGLASPSNWLSDRPDAPQLPLYAVLNPSDEPLAAVAFALLRAGDDLDLCGFTDTPGLLPRTSRMNFPTLDAQLDDWFRVLTGLAHDYAEGTPRTNPKSYPRTCVHCTQRILCRLDPATLNQPSPFERDEDRDTEFEPADG